MHRLRAPRLNPNDDAVELIEWLKAPGTFVRAGEAVCVVETSKAIVEVAAEADGYLTPLARAGERVAVGAALAALTEMPDEEVGPEAPGASDGAVVARAFTRKAEIAARRLGVDLEQLAALLSGDARITEADVETVARTGGLRRAAEQTSGDLVDDVYVQRRAERVLVIGAGRAAVQVLDALSRRADQRAVAIVDDNRPAGLTVMGVPIVGPVSAAATLAAQGAFDGAIAALGTPAERAQTQAALAAEGVRFINVIDPAAIISANVTLGSGNFLSAGARLGPCATLGDGNFVSAMCSLEHHNVIGSYCHFGPAVVTSGSVTIGDRVLFGTGIHIEPDLGIGDDCIVSSGVTVTQPVPPRSSVKAQGAAIVRPR